jgi:hypothetical protein
MHSHRELSGDLAIVLAVCGGQDDASSQRDLLACVMSSD